MMKKQLVQLAHARSGDKGDKADLSLFAPDQLTYDLLAREVTAERVQSHFAGLITGHVERYQLPNILALKFVLHGALNGGASRSLRSDALGKSLSSALLRMEIEIEGSAHKELLRTKREDILLIARKYGVYNVRIFGSVAREEDDAESDIDLLVDMEPKHSLLDLGGFLIEVEDLLGCKVDAVTEDGLRDRIRDRVLKEAIPLSEV